MERTIDFVAAFILSLATLWLVWVTPAAHQVATAAGLVAFDVAYYYYRLSSKLDK